MSRLLFLLALSWTVAVRGQCPEDDSLLEAWSDPATWSTGQVPADGKIVTITKPVLLSTTTNRLGGVILKDGGKLVFDPTADLAKLVTRYVHIQNEGGLHIGSSTCEFTGNAEILLFGAQDGLLEVGDFGQKFVGVDVGGSLEIHGIQPLPFTHLTETLTPKSKYFNTDRDGEQHTDRTGFVLYEFVPADGSLVQVVEAIQTAQAMTDAIASVTPGNVVILSKQHKVPNRVWKVIDDIAAVIETDLLQSAGTLHFGDLSLQGDAWTLMVDTANPTGYIEDWDVSEGADDQDGTFTDVIEMTVSGTVFKTQTSSRQGTKGVSFLYVDVYDEDHYNHMIKVEDDISSWSVGDLIVIASTDYDMEQAEKYEISSIDVDAKTITFDGDLKYTHWGQVEEDIDMRAEVAMFTRNVKIHGEMAEYCYDEESNHCEYFGEDTFGGHTKAVKGFKSYNIEGAEFFDMGQATVLGRYPVHFHMCNETMRDGVNQIVRGNAFHNTKSRCVTIHGSHNVHVKDNVAYDHYGHCYFLEDGGEKGTVLDHNLGMGTKVGVLTPSDAEPTTFWITSPLTQVTNNVAAGSVSNAGVGIWYLFPDEPVGPSRGEGYFGYREAKRTPIWTFYNNKAHSNGNIGLAFFKRLGDVHEIIGCSTYSPRIDPTDDQSEFSPIVLDTFTGYKNRRKNVVLRSTAAELVNFKVAHSLVGIYLNRNMLGGYQRVRDTLIVGETNNIGVGERIRLVNPDGTSYWAYREGSVPIKWSPYLPMVGIEIDAEGPSHLENVEFRNLLHTDLRVGAAIMWHDMYNFHNGATTSSQGLSFNFADPDEGYYMYEENIQTGRVESSILMNDLDGTLTGKAGSVVVKPNMYYTANKVCTARSGWNLEVCEDSRFSKFFIWPMIDESLGTFVTNPSGEVTAVENAMNLRIAYLVDPEAEYVMHWAAEMGENGIKARMAGMMGGESITVGFCVPEELACYQDDIAKLFWMESDIVEASDLADLKSDTTGKNLFFDRSLGIVYRKFTEDRLREAADLSDCIGGMKQVDACPYITVRFKPLEGAANLLDGDCRARSAITC